MRCSSTVPARSASSTVCILESDALSIASSREFGRYYVAARPIKQGETVLYAHPEAWAPLWPCELSELSPRELNIMRADAGPNPPSGEPLTEEEEDDREFMGSCSQNWLLAVRAALLLQDERTAFSNLLTLADHGNTRPPAQQSQLRQLGARMQRALRAGAGLEVDEASLVKILGAILTNAFGTRNGFFGLAVSGGGADGVGLFSAASLFNHSCAPNCFADLSLLLRDEREGPPATGRSDGEQAEGVAVLSLQQLGTILFVAYRYLEEGESVTISYLDSSEPNHVRRRMLRRTKLFTCRCALCFDPLEAGRGGSQLRCPACKKWQTPEEAPVGQKARRLGVTPKHLPETSAWLCAGCGARTPRAEVWALERSLRRALEEAETEAEHEAVEQRALARLHPHHAILLQVKLSRLAYCVRDGAADAAEARRRIGLAEEALATARLLLEPFDPQKADLLFRLGSWQHALGALSPAGSEEARAAFHAGSKSLLESAQQFAFVCGAAEKPTAAAKELAGLCMRSLQAARAGGS